MTPEIIALLKQILTVLTTIATILTSIFGALALIVKFVKTLPDNHWFLPTVKILAEITNNQVDHASIRQGEKNETSSTAVNNPTHNLD